jgi:Spy/CpxP family protein refolding chaperone
MRQVLFAGAALAAAGLVAMTSANAQMAYEAGGPVKKGAMCQVNTGGDGYYGYWRECPAPAKVAHVKKKAKS